MLNIVKIIILSIIQGFTEWLPISSSGHLVIFSKILNFPISVSFNLALHLGTVLAALFYFKKDILKITKDFLTLNFKTQDGKFSLYIIIALIPTAILGLLFKNFIEQVFSSLIIISLALLITGSLLFIASFYEPKGKINSGKSFLTGIFQGLSMVPGFSRSGFTISSLIFSKVKREQAAKFSFILAIPTILAASFLKIKDIATIAIDELVIGIILAASVGLIAIHLLLYLFLHKKFRWFAYYCWLLGLIVLLFVLI